jgi:drug/metabolite transporter (DMT)-like permease
VKAATKGHHHKTSIKIGLLAAIATVASWTTWIISTRIAVDQEAPLSPALLAFIRFGTAAVVLSPYWWRLGVAPKGMKPAVGLGLMFAGLPYLFAVVLGLRYAPATEAGPLLTGTLPLFVGALSVLVLGERFTRHRLAGLALIGAGTLFIVAPSFFRPGSQNWIGHLFVLLGAASWSIYTIAFRKSGLNAVQAASLVGLWSVIALLPFAAADILRDLQTTPATTLLQQIAIQGLLAGVLALILYTTAVTRLGPSRTTAVTAITPVSALLTAFILLGEQPEPLGITGCVLIVAGVVFASGVLVELRARNNTAP